jgi:hypothetical protein
MHEGVREIPRPQLVLHQGRDIFAEIDMDVLSLQSLSLRKKLNVVVSFDGG